MRFHKSVKLLNYLQDNNGYLTFYSELDHTFKIDDVIFITGGYYDNTNDLTYNTSYINGDPTTYKFNPFKKVTRGYKVLDVNLANNSFTLDIETPGNIYFPYANKAATTNYFGDPNISTPGEIAVNNYFNANGLYNYVIASQVVFGAKRFVNGTINNGIFGNDYRSSRINLNGSSTNVIINHIASKNTVVNSTIILSKTDTSNISSVKCELVENGYAGTINVKELTINNNKYGYSLFDNFTCEDNVKIYNGDFEKPSDKYYDSVYDLYTGIDFFGSEIFKAKIGSNVFSTIQSNLIENITIHNSDVYFANNNSAYTIFDNCNIKKYITFDLDLIDPAYDILNPGKITFYVKYQNIANTYLALGNMHFGWVTGINNNVTNNKEDNLINKEVSIQATHTYLDYTPGLTYIDVIFLDFTTLSIGDWITYITTNPIIDYDFSKMQFHINSNSNLDVIKVTGISTVNMMHSSLSGQTYLHLDGINGLINVQSGIYDGIYFTPNVNFNTSSGVITLINNTFIYGSYTAENTFNNCILKDNNNITGIFTNSILKDGVYVNSNITNSNLVKVTKDVYIYNSELYGNIQTYLETPGVFPALSTFAAGDYIKWNLIYFDPLNNNSAQFNGRKTKFRTNKQTQLRNKTKRTNINYKYKKILRLMPVTIDGELQSVVTTTLDPYNILNLNVNNVSGLKTSTVTSNTNIFYAFNDLGNMYVGDELPISLNATLNRYDVIYAGILDDNTLLKTVTTNINTNTTSGLYTLFPTTASFADVDDNFVYSDLKYSKNIRSRDYNYMELAVNEFVHADAALSTQADPADGTLTTNLLMNYFLDLGFGTPGDVDVIDDTTRYTVPNGALYKLFFKRTLGASTVVPRCFIEIQTVKLEAQSSAYVTQFEETIFCNYCPPTAGLAENGNEYLYNTPHIANASYPTSFEIKPYKPFVNANFISIITIPGTDATNVYTAPCFKITINYTITYAYDETNTNYSSGYTKNFTNVFLIDS